MGKIYTFSDRTYRYNSRTNKKLISDLNSEIKKKTEESKKNASGYLNNYNCLVRTNSYNQFIYSVYINLHNKYRDLYELFIKTDKNLKETVNSLKVLQNQYDILESGAVNSALDSAETALDAAETALDAADCSIDTKSITSN
tara:strand:- start:2577 stop:3002 length:426 start_codon:yes stop_codon:yes gene_type:complete